MKKFALVLLPGLDGTGLLFEPLIAALPPAIRPFVIAYPVDEVLGYDALASHVIERLPAGEPFVLLGESFGGPLAAMVPARRPSGLVGLVLCATFMTSPRPVLGPLLRPLARAWPFRLYPAYQRVRRWTGGRATAGSWAAAADVSRLVRPAVVAARVRMTLSVDARRAAGLPGAAPVPLREAGLGGAACKPSADPARSARRVGDHRRVVAPGAAASPSRMCGGDRRLRAATGGNTGPV